MRHPHELPTTHGLNSGHPGRGILDWPSLSTNASLAKSDSRSGRKLGKLPPAGPLAIVALTARSIMDTYPSSNDDTRCPYTDLTMIATVNLHEE